MEGQEASRGWRGEVAALRRMMGWDDFLFRDARYFAVRVRLDAAVARRVVPGPLRLASPPTGTLFVAHFPETSFGSVYSEAGFFVDVRRRRRPALHCPWIIVDDDIALITGRELLGYPKKMGRIVIEEEPGRVHATVERRGARLFELHMKLGAKAEDPPPMLGRLTVNVVPGTGFPWPRMVAFTPREEILEAHLAEAALELGSSPRDPLEALGIGEVLSAMAYRVNLGRRGLPRALRPLSPTFWLDTWRLRFQ